MPPTSNTTSTTAADAPVPETFARIPLTDLSPSPTNPRKHFDPARLQELADSIIATGLHQPILVRRLDKWQIANLAMRLNSAGQRRPDDPVPTFEIVAGERRYRACKLAGLADAPCVIRQLTDAQVLEVQVIENLQRDDLTAFEEAHGYDALRNGASNLTAEQIAAKIGKSKRYVFNRLKLLDLCSDATTALREGRIDATRALIIASIPAAAAQKRALAEAVKLQPYGLNAGKEPSYSVRELASWVKNNVMLRIKDARFDIARVALVPNAGACTSCPKNTGCAPDLFEDALGAGSDNLCTDSECWAAKEEAHLNHAIDTARKAGHEIIDGKDAQAAIRVHWNGAKHGHEVKDHTLLATTLDHDGELHAVRDLAKGGRAADGSKLAPLTTFGYINANQAEVITCVRTADLDAQLRQRGWLADGAEVEDLEHTGASDDDFSRHNKPQAPQAPATVKDAEAQINLLRLRSAEADRRLAHARQEAAQDILKTAIAQALHAAPDTIMAAVWADPTWIRPLLASILDDAWGAEEERILNLDPATLTTGPDDDEIEALRLHLQATPLAGLLRMLTVHLVLAAANTEDVFNDTGKRIEHGGALLHRLASQLGIDTSAANLAAVENDDVQDRQHAADEATKQLKAAHAHLANLQAAEAAAPAKTTSQKGPANAVNGLDTGTAQAPAGQKPRGRGKAIAKLSPDEAQSGIAAAMQSIEATPPSDGVEPQAQAAPKPAKGGKGGGGGRSKKTADADLEGAKA
jgi:ParB/RepB/Spo0J family partition protein